MEEKTAIQKGVGPVVWGALEKSRSSVIYISWTIKVKSYIIFCCLNIIIDCYDAHFKKVHSIYNNNRDWSAVRYQINDFFQLPLCKVVIIIYSMKL